VSIIFESISPLLLIIKKSADNIAKRTIFLSYSSSNLSGLYKPSVSSIINHLTPALLGKSSGNFYKVK
jgi:hypothetical protein